MLSPLRGNAVIQGLNIGALDGQRPLCPEDLEAVFSMSGLRNLTATSQRLTGQIARYYPTDSPIVHFQASNCHLNAADLEKLLTAENRKTLDLSGNPLKGAFEKISKPRYLWTKKGIDLRSIKPIDRLNLSNCTLTAGDLRAISHMPLGHLVLNHAQIPLGALQNLGASPIKQLDINGLTLNHADVKTIAGELPRLEGLGCSEVKGLTPYLHLFRGNNRLVKLRANSTRMEESSLTIINSFEGLVSLNISNNPQLSGNFENLANNQTIAYLNASECGVTPEDIKAIATMKALHRIDLTGNGLTRDDLLPLAEAVFNRAPIEMVRIGEDYRVTEPSFSISRTVVLGPTNLLDMYQKYLETQSPGEAVENPREDGTQRQRGDRGHAGP